MTKQCSYNEHDTRRSGHAIAILDEDGVTVHTQFIDRDGTPGPEKTTTLPAGFHSAEKALLACASHVWGQWHGARRAAIAAKKAAAAARLERLRLVCKHPRWVWSRRAADGMGDLVCSVCGDELGPVCFPYEGE